MKDACTGQGFLPGLDVAEVLHVFELLAVGCGLLVVCGSLLADR